MALNFPNSPTNGQIYFDVSSGNRYIYDSANTIWKYAANNSLEGSANSQILFNNEGAIDGSDALVFEANTLYSQEIVVTQNATATYYFGNGAFLTGISATGVSDLTPANNWANTLSTTDRAIANAAANSANAYTVTVGAAANNYANASFYTIANGAITFTAANGAYINANNAANSANAYTVTVGAAANTFATTQDNNVRAFANSTANSANAYTVTVGAAANTFATSQDNNVRAFANSTANSANAYAVTVGAASNTWANATFYTAANGAIAFTAANGAYINANNAANSANAYTVTVGAAANTWANTKLANTTTTLAGTLTLTGSLTLVGNSSIFSNTLVTSVATSQILDSFATATWRSANYVVTMTAGTDYHTTQVSLVHDGTNAFITEYGTVSTANNLGLFDANIVSGTVRLNVIPTFAVTTINLLRTTNK